MGTPGGGGGDSYGYTWGGGGGGGDRGTPTVEYKTGQTSHPTSTP